MSLFASASKVPEEVLMSSIGNVPQQGNVVSLPVVVPASSFVTVAQPGLIGVPTQQPTSFTAGIPQQPGVAPVQQVPVQQNNLINTLVQTIQALVALVTQQQQGTGGTQQAQQVAQQPTPQPAQQTSYQNHQHGHASKNNGSANQNAGQNNNMMQAMLQMIMGIFQMMMAMLQSSNQQKR